MSKKKGIVWIFSWTLVAFIMLVWLGFIVAPRYTDMSINHLNKAFSIIAVAGVCSSFVSFVVGVICTTESRIVGSIATTIFLFSFFLLILSIFVTIEL